jgi:hypothetical protein
LGGHLDDSDRQIVDHIAEWKNREFCSARCSSGADGSIGAIVKHLGILATTPEGAALCFLTFCQQGASELGPMSIQM